MEAARHLAQTHFIRVISIGFKGQLGQLLHGTGQHGGTLVDQLPLTQTQQQKTAHEQGRSNQKNQMQGDFRPQAMGTRHGLNHSKAERERELRDNVQTIAQED